MATTQSKELFLRSLLGNNKSPKTIRAYGDDLKQFIEWVGKSRIDLENPKHFTRIDVIEFMNHLASIKMTGVTRARKLAAIRKFFSFMKENDIIAGNPVDTIKQPKKEEKTPNILYQEQYKALLFEASQNVRDFAILMTFLQTGIRLSELVNLKLDDVDMENKMLTVRQGKGKKDREIPLENQSYNALKRYLRFRDTELILHDDIFFLAKNGTSINVSVIKHMVQKYVKKAGIKKKISVHTLRHTYATHKAKKGMSIASLKELLGHERMETTYRYVHLAQTSLRDEQERTGL